MTLTFENIKQAAERIQPYIKQTPILTSSTLNKLTQAELYFKCENFQKTGTFKFRGACNAVFALTDEQAKHGVMTYSSGNHGQALALAAKVRGIPAYIAMPKQCAAVKKQAVAEYGAHIYFCEPALEARELALQKITAETGAILVHPYDNEYVIAGQGTVGLELLAQCHHLDEVIVPVGGGGLIAGIATAIKQLESRIQIIGAEPESANDAYLSFIKKELIPAMPQQTICDGLLTPVGKITFPIILDKVHAIYTSNEQATLKALHYIWERMKIVVEPSAAVALSIILENPDIFKNKKIGLILSGGNVDIKKIASLL